MCYRLGLLNTNNYSTRCHSFSTFLKFSEKLTFLTPRYTHVRVFRNVSFPKNFAYVLN